MICLNNVVMSGALLLRVVLALLIGTISACADDPEADRQASSAPKSGERIVVIGNTLGSRMLYYPHFETELQSRYPGTGLIMRNLSRPGDTPGFRPHPSRETPWAFPGADTFHPTMKHRGVGHYPPPDEWLTMLKADTILAFFGYNESFEGEAGRANFHAELTAFVQHTLNQIYNGRSAPRLVLVSPIAFEDLSDQQDLPDGAAENKRLAAYRDTMAEVAKEQNVEFIDIFAPTQALYENSDQPLTINGFSLTDAGYRALAPVLADALYGDAPNDTGAAYGPLYDAIADKNWFWLNDYRMLNGVHVYGRRYEPFGNVNYPEEIEKIRQMTELRDGRIHALAAGEVDVADADDSETRVLTPIETNFTRPIEFLNVDKALERFTLPKGYEIDLFASESEFPDLKNPVQISFDNKGRLWVAVAPSYPHYKPGDERPNDKLLILEDTDGDGRADKQTVFADNLHLPFGFELAAEGVYLAQIPNLVLLADDDGDDRADRMELLMHGFDPHDSHHAISTFTADASGAFFMAEGVFLHSQVETPYGPQRVVDAGVWRFDPKNWRLERFMQAYFANPWGIMTDTWDQTFLADASGGSNWWSLPISAKAPHGFQTKKVGEFTTHKVRPTSGIEFVHSRHFPDAVQGDFLINNTIGFLGTKQHTMTDDGAGFTGELRQDLVSSDDPNFRPVDLEFAPDGSLYIVDWHNPLVGHMQHSARDPNRDHDHGRIYRVTYPGRPLVEPAAIDGAPIEQLLANLKLPEYRTRYRTRRELRGRDTDDVLSAVKTWVASLDRANENYDHNVLEALWTTWAQNHVDADLLRQVLGSSNHRARAAGVRVLRYAWRQVADHEALFIAAAGDPHPRVRLEAVVAASWLNNAAGARIALEGMKHPITRWMGKAYEAILLTLDDDIRGLNANLTDNPTAMAYLDGALVLYEEAAATGPETLNITADELKIFERGREIYSRDGHCATCHGEDGKGTMADIYPPLNGNQWVTGDETRLIKLALKGLYGPITVGDKTFEPGAGVPPMPGFAGMMSDEELAAVLSYVRTWFGDMGTTTSRSERGWITPETIAAVRAEIANKDDNYTVEELLAEHPME